MGYHKLAEALREAQSWINQFAKIRSAELDAKVAEALAAHEAEQQAGEAVAYGMPNSALTGRNRWMLLREEVPPNDQYGGALWVPLYTRPQQPLSDEQAANLAKRGPVHCDEGGRVIRSAAGYRSELQEAIFHGIRIAERAHGITKDTK